jgi:hypothetical protein
MAARARSAGQSAGTSAARGGTARSGRAPTRAYSRPGGETFAPIPGFQGVGATLRGPVMRVRRLLLLVLLGAGPVRAHSVSNELALGLSEDSPASPHGPHVADQLTFRFDLSDDWSMKLGGTYTYDTETPPPEGGAFATSSAQVLSVVGGLDWDVSPRVTTYLEASGSPRASQSFDGLVSFQGPGGNQGSLQRAALQRHLERRAARWGYLAARRQRISRHRVRRNGHRPERRVDAADHPAADRRHRRRRQAEQPRRPPRILRAVSEAVRGSPSLPEGRRGQPEPARSCRSRYSSRWDRAPISDWLEAITGTTRTRRSRCSSPPGRTPRPETRSALAFPWLRFAGRSAPTWPSASVAGPWPRGTST